jgi:plasmid stabilization system protein ParE
MAKSVEIIWTMKSKSDLKQIYTQLCTQIPEEKVFEVVQRIITKVDMLAEMPEMGQRETLLAKLKKVYRRLVESHYKIIYNFTDDTIYINRIFDSRQNPNKLTVK